MKKYCKTLILMILLITSVIGTYYNDGIYKKEILKITKIETIREDTSENSLGLTEKYETKKITGILQNGKQKGKKKEIEYEESFSSVVTEKYQVGDKVFLDHGEIDGLKRDYYIMILLSIFILSIYMVGEKKGLLSIVSVILNVIIFYLGLFLYFKGINLLFLCLIESFLFAGTSLIISNGLNKKTTSAILSVSVSSIIIVLLLLLVSKTTNYKGIYFNELEFLTVPPEDILLPELLIGSVGAIMDVAITISSSISELINKSKKISKKQLRNSAKEIGKDIMSTMTSVLFFTYLSAGLPFFVLAVRNGYSVVTYFTTNYSLEITRFLVGSIGIIITIPITTEIAIHRMKEGIK